MQIYKIIFSLLTFFPYLITFLWAWLKGACRQTEVQTNKQTNRRSLADKQTKNRQGAGIANSGAYYIPVLTPDATSRPAASIARPTASLPLCPPRNYGRGLVIYA